MTKLIILYGRPVDGEEFERHFAGVHVPLLEQCPGLSGLEITSMEDNQPGTLKVRFMAELRFPSRQDLDRAMASPQGKAISRDLMAFAASNTYIYIGETTSPATRTDK